MIFNYMTAPPRKPDGHRAHVFVFNDDDEQSRPSPTSSSPGEFQNAGRRLNLLSRLSTKSSRNVQAGALSLLKDLPTDILYEVFGHLHPMDLLALSRTSRCLRSLLLSKSSLSVWRQSLGAVDGLPECPLDMSEPKYTSLTFDNFCHFCFGPAPKVRDIFWTCRVRCCRNCLTAQFVTEYELEQELPELQSIRKKEAIIPYIVYPKPSRHRPGRILFSLSAAKKLAGELEVEPLCSEIDIVHWKQEKLIQQIERLQHARLCESWCSRWSYQRPEEFDHIVIAVLLGLLLYLWREQIL